MSDEIEHDINSANPTHSKYGNIRAISLGCRLNTYETEAMKLAARSINEEIVLINTCAVTSEAVRQAKQTIRRAKRDNPNAKIIVSGCAAQIDPQSFADMEEVEKVIGNNEKTKPETYQGLLLNEERIIVDDILSVKETASHLIDGIEGRTRAYIQVQNGCDHRCTFCIIPYGRGNSRSVPAAEVVRTINRLVDNGVKEVVLSGVDLTSWGGDLPASPNLGNLVDRIFKLCPDLVRLRLSSIDAIEIDENLFRNFAQNPRLMPHLHLSLQHGNDLILKRMKRRHLRKDAIDLVARLKAARPEIVFGADIIAGFPTETEEHFQDSLSLLEEANITYAHIFPYSPRPGTPAQKMPQVARNIIKERAAILRAKGAQLLSQHLQSQIGNVQDILIEANGYGRLENFTRVKIENGIQGEIIKAKIIGASEDYLII